MSKKYGMVIDLHRCVGCGACDLACKTENNTADGIYWSFHSNETTGTFPNTSFTYIPKLCNHCENAPCVRVCPTKAMHKDADTGMTLHNESICIGCKSCVLACPYGVISANDRTPFTERLSDKALVAGGTFSPKELGDKSGKLYPNLNLERGKTYPVVRSKGSVEKCTFCDHRVKAGLNPHCVDSCPANARIFGDLNDPNSAPSKLLNQYPAKGLLEERGTKPKVLYIRNYQKT